MALKTRAEEIAEGMVVPAAGAMFNQASKGVEQTAASVRHGMRQATAGLEQTQAEVKEGMEIAMKTAQDFVTFGQGNLEAFAKSGQIWAAGMQDIGKQVAATAQAQFEETASAFRAITAARSVKDAVDVQANLARSVIEKRLADSSRLTESSIKVTEQALAPLTSRVTLAVEKFGRSV
ncbi:MAG: phasin family protein [Pseudomonadota bacterium]|nr:phasin family protein [Pseudomonadota bacterium]